MPRSKVRWPNELTAWLTLKADNPNLSHEEFYRVRGLKAKTAQKRIGKKMSDLWGKARTIAEQALAKSTGISLARELEATFRAGKVIFSDASGRLLPDVTKKVKRGKTLKAELVPKTAGEAAKVAKLGLDAMMGVTQRLTGGERMLPKSKTADVDPVFRWTNAPEQPKARKPKKRR